MYRSTLLFLSSAFLFTIVLSSTTKARIKSNPTDAKSSKNTTSLTYSNGKCLAYKSRHNDNCFEVGTTFGLNRTEFFALNPRIRCRPQLKEGTVVCVGKLKKRGPKDEAEELERLLNGDDEALGNLKGLFDVDAGKKPTIKETIGSYRANELYEKQRRNAKRTRRNVRV